MVVVSCSALVVYGCLLLVACCLMFVGCVLLCVVCLFGLFLVGWFSIVGYSLLVIGFMGVFVVCSLFLVVSL